jgi:hypothetical protein
VITDNLASLFAPNPRGAAQEATFRVGVLLEFDNGSGANMVAIGTSQIPNLPFLLTGAEVGFESGDNVLVMILGSSLMIIGKIASVGSDAFASRSISTQKTGGTGSGFALPTARTTLATCTLTVPPWANTASIVGHFTYSAQNNFGSGVDILIGMQLDGDDSGEFDGSGPSAARVSQAMGHATKHTVAPNSLLTCNGTARCTGGFTANAGNIALINVLAIYTKEDSS